MIKPCALIPDSVHMCCTLVPEMLCHPSHGTDCPKMWEGLATPTEILLPVNWLSQFRFDSVPSEEYILFMSRVSHASHPFCVATLVE